MPLGEGITPHPTKSFGHSDSIAADEIAHYFIGSCPFFALHCPFFTRLP
jgi:hypothetical protein